MEQALVNRLVLIKILLLSLVTFAAAGEIYQWKDSEGNVHFGDRPPASAKPKRVEVKINTYQSVEETYSPDWFYKGNKSVGRQQVVMYSAEWCGVCKRAKAYFQQKRIAFSERDIDKSKSARTEFDKLGGKGVPIILVGEKRMNGFNAERFDRMYYGK